LGNVLATISDKNIQKSTGGDTVKYYIADVVTANDYYPFGMLQPGRKYAQNSSSYRYSINSQEKESDLNDNITTAQFWEYDSRLARRWNVDPIYQISPYGCFSNNPLRFSDQLGKDTGDVVVLFAGANLGGAITKAFGGGKGSTPDIKKELLKSLTQNGTSVATFTSGYWGVDLKTEKGFDEATQAAYEYIKKNHIEGGRVAIYGYSWGANFVSYLAGRLAKDGISVELGITIDAAGGFSNGDVNRTIDKNVAVNLNYYQTNYSKITGSHGGPNKAQDPQKTRIFNYDLTGTPYRSNDCSVCEESDEYTPVSHSNIHLATKEYVIRKIVELLDVDNGIRLPSPPPFKMEPNKPISTRVDKIYPQLPIKFN